MNSERIWDYLGPIIDSKWYNPVCVVVSLSPLLLMIPATKDLCSHLEEKRRSQPAVEVLQSPPVDSLSRRIVYPALPLEDPFLSRRPPLHN